LAECGGILRRLESRVRRCGQRTGTIIELGSLMNFQVWTIVAVLPLVLGQVGWAHNSKGRNPDTVQEMPAQDNQERKEAILRQLRSSKLDDRMAALHILVGHDRSLPFLRDEKIRAAVIDLLHRETINARDYDTGERTDFQYYQSFLLDVVKQIAVDYDSSNAWKTLVDSNYGTGSPFGEWLARQPAAYAHLMDRIDDKDDTRRSQTLSMLGQVCAGRPTTCSKILPALRERTSSADSWTRQGAIAGLGACGTFEDIAFLRALPACSSDLSTRPLCHLMEDKITKRLTEHEHQ